MVVVLVFLLLVVMVASDADPIPSDTTPSHVVPYHLPSHSPFPHPIIPPIVLVCDSRSHSPPLPSHCLVDR
jgi:hypothetical protein